MGVARQSCGMLGRQDNRQVAVRVSRSAQGGCLPVAWPLQRPREWGEGQARRPKAGGPRELAIATQPATARAQIARLRDQGLPRHCLLADAGSGSQTAFPRAWASWGRPTGWA